MKKYIFLLIIVTITISCGKDLLDSEKEILISYLQENNSIIDPGSEFNDDEFAVLTPNLENNKVFLFGEMHAVFYNEIIDVKLLKYLYYNANVRYYLAESSYSNAALINNYVQTGDIANLDYVYQLLRQQGTLSGNQSSYYKWRNIYEFNKMLPANEKINIVGIDVEHQVNAAYFFLNSLLPTEAPPTAIFDRIEKIRNYQLIQNDEEKYSLGYLVFSDMSNNNEAYKKYLGNKYFDFQFVISNLYNTKKYKFPTRNNSVREAAIYENFKKIRSHIPNAKYYGKWGREHVLQNYVTTQNTNSDENRFAIYLNSDSSNVRGQVLSILGIYLKCKYLSNYKGFHSKSVSEEYKNNDLIDFDKSEIQLFNLDSENSPFRNNLYFFEKGLSNSTIDYCRYILKIKNSPACEE